MPVSQPHLGDIFLRCTNPVQEKNTSLCQGNADSVTTT